jgi:DME family drug/metabolite transporter
MERDEHYLRGVGLVVLGGFFISQSGVLIGLMDNAGVWQVQFYRSLAAIAVLGSITLFKYRGRVGRAFASGLLAMLATGVFLAISNLFYIGAFFHTRAASVFFIISSQPFFAAIAGWLVLREPVRRVTWLAMTVALAGVAVMMWEGLGEGHLIGNLMALGAAIFFAAFGVSLRGGRHSDMVPGVMLASIIVGAISATQAGDFAISDHDLGLCLYMGAFQVSASLVLYAAGAKYVPAAELMVLALVEVIIGPIWVWVILDEAPTLLGVLGGAIVVGAVFANAMTGLRRR